MFVSRSEGLGETPDDGAFVAWVEAALAGRTDHAEVAIALVGAEESRDFNLRYRDRDKPTNVLSFPAELPEAVAAELDCRPLGDLVICVPLVGEEAAERAISPAHHWAHLVTHGTLHLLGYDHIEEADAARMEAEEIAILAGQGIDDPYIDRRS
ncbi:rRNA maturation RNase YbeY [Marinihelvus fidelis]|uniref:rRNA maturation RNase YbeY n=1 Tax=Marinihelvus fidelis TaxID=2613842 RepID=UPI001CD36382|nr:rRNA maturation RNase YbeY [Marinihelvus fidelis]